MTSRSSSVRKLGKRHISVFRYFTATRGIHSTSASFQTSWLAESGAHDLVVATLSTMAARGLRHTAVSMNELNSHCSDAVTTMAMDIAPAIHSPRPVPRLSYVLSSCLQSFTSSILIPPLCRFRYNALFLSHFSIIAHTSLCGSSVFPRFSSRCILCSANHEIVGLTITTLSLRYFLSLLDFAIRHLY